MNNKKLFLIYLSSYLLIRVISFYFAPGTAVNIFLSFLLIASFSLVLLKNENIAGAIVASEMMLGGSGNFFQIYGISTRTILLGITILYYSAKYWKDVFSRKPINIMIFSIIGIGALGALNGFYHQNSTNLVISDFIPYLFLFYYFPLRKLLNKGIWINYVKPAVWAAIAGSFGFIMLTFVGFSTGKFILQDPYYHWFRDIAGGKITFVEFNFFRLVLNEHLLLAPAFVYCFYQSLKNKKLYFYLGALLLAILAINLTRVYFLGIAAGILTLLPKTNFRLWLKRVGAYSLIFITIFCTLFMLGSGGHSLGLEVFGLRIQSIIMPNIENSSLSRILLLPEIWNKIKKEPMLGSGLGSTISVYSPIFNKVVTTPHFDWGYFELAAELGVIGLTSWIAFLIFSFMKLKKHPGFLLAAFVSMLIINITSPAVFHVFGFILIAFLIAVSDHVSQE